MSEGKEKDTRKRKERSAKPFQLLRKLTEIGEGESRIVLPEEPEIWASVDIPDGCPDKDSIASTSDALRVLRYVPEGRYAIVQVAAVKTVKVNPSPGMIVTD